MKQFLLATIVMGMGALAGAQMKQGRIIYERTSEIQSRVRKGGAKDFEESTIKDVRTYQLLFANNKSVFELVPDVSALSQKEEGQGRSIIIGGAPGVLFANLDKNITVEEIDFNGQALLIEDEIEKLKWKKTDETKTLLGYKVFKATAPNVVTRTMPAMENGQMKMMQVTDTVQVEAWYCPEIPVAVGPNLPGQLEGAILELKQENGRDVFKAVEVSKKVSESDVKEPKKGKRISVEDFRKEEKKAAEAMSERLRARSRQ